MRLRLLFTAGVLLLAPTPSYAEKKPTLREMLKQFTGKPLAEAIGKLGLPADKMEIPGATIYSWKIGNVFAGGDPLECTVRLSVNEAGIVGQGDVDGNRGACDIFVKKLR